MRPLEELHEAVPPPKDQFIVAEVSKNWINGHEVSVTGPIAAQFERVINVNAERGYRLVSFSLHRMMTREDELNETIIAVFEKANAAWP